MYACLSLYIYRYVFYSHSRMLTPTTDQKEFRENRSYIQIYLYRCMHIFVYVQTLHNNIYTCANGFFSYLYMPPKKRCCCYSAWGSQNKQQMELLLSWGFPTEDAKQLFDLTYPNRYQMSKTHIYFNKSKPI